MPYLVCDPPLPEEQVEYYTIVGLPDNPQAPLSDDPAYGVKYDITDVPPGTYTLQVSACNKWSCSLPAPFDFIVPEPPSVPVGLSILFD